MVIYSDHKSVTHVADSLCWLEDIDKAILTQQLAEAQETDIELQNILRGNHPISTVQLC